MRRDVKLSNSTVYRNEGLYPVVSSEMWRYSRKLRQCGRAYTNLRQRVTG